MPKNFSTWLTVGCGFISIGVFAWLQFSTPSNSNIAIANEFTASDLLELAAKDKSKQISGLAPTDPQCSQDIDPLECFLTRLEQENQQQMMRVVLINRALEIAREDQKNGQ